MLGDAGYRVLIFTVREFLGQYYEGRGKGVQIREWMSV